MLPDRALVLVFAWTLNVTSPLPVPVPWATSIHGADFDADQVHAAAVVTVNRPLPPPAATPWEVGLMAKLHDRAVCRTVTCSPATVSVPVRAAPVFAATAIEMAALPVPDDADAMVSHGVPLTTVQAHPAPMPSWMAC